MHLECIIPFPNETIKAKYDVTEQIYCTVTTYKLDASYHWVKGHQDDHTPVEELPIAAQLNVESDKLAGIYQEEHRKF